MNTPTLTLVFKDRQEMIDQLSIPENQPKHIKLPDGKIKVVISGCKSQMVMDTTPLLQKKPALTKVATQSEEPKQKVISKQHKDLSSKLVSSAELVIPKKYQLHHLSVGDKIEYWSKAASRNKQKFFQLRTGVIVSVAGKRRFAVVRRMDEPSPKPGTAWNVDPKVILNLTRNASMEKRERERAIEIAQRYRAEIDHIKGRSSDSSTSRYWSPPSSDQDAESSDEPQVELQAEDNYINREDTNDMDMESIRDDLLV